ncbi:MAG: transaldolase family protein [Cyanobacteriota bacterium]
MALRLFLDSACRTDWDQWLPTGLFHGVTTNPTLLRRAGEACRLDALQAVYERADRHGCQEIHLQTWGNSVTEACERGLALSALDPRRVVVKVPIDRQGCQTARQLISAGVRVTFTACYEPAQVLVAAALGADYVAPYLGRICDRERDGHREVITMQQALTGVGSAVRVLVASLRSKEDLPRLAAAGLNTFTISAVIAADLFSNTDTIAAAEVFERDAAG